MIRNRQRDPIIEGPEVPQDPPPARPGKPDRDEDAGLGQVASGS
jgi:hypothetical protein